MRRDGVAGLERPLASLLRRLSALGGNLGRGPAWRADSSRETPWPITLHSARTYTETRMEHRFHNRRREGFRAPLLQWTLSGKGRLDYQGECRDLVPGDLMVLELPGDATYGLANRGGHWTFLYFHLDGPWSLPWVRRFLSHWGPVVRPDPAGAFAGTAEDLHLGICRGEWHPARVSAVTWAMLMGLEEELDRGPSPNRPGVAIDAGAPPWLARVEARMAALDPRSHLDLEALASLSGYSKYHFLRRYKTLRGHTPMEAMRRLRVEAAGRLLAGTNASTRAVAEAVGWENPAALARTLKQITGFGLREWRTGRATGTSGPNRRSLARGG